ncbi:response regulator transcription factor [Geobacter sp. FeAm09]|uniref:response regulator transcription factor n=1 Tax=Geobacter sp. FeAm09 TaxID=2597769 RepID=UPI0011ECA404|nr:response regulator transcription factor [Geobacter sp. FeAm09]QEM67643.1 response regulator transcription factor [Geobacter sp. FeAm09]
MDSILIIEDDPSYRNMMELILQMEGFDVRTAVDGQSGLDLLHEKRPDLVLCDILMPDLDGHQVLEALKSEHAYAEIPFIFVTAMGARGEIRFGMAKGADDYLPKPFSASELLEAVTSRLRRHKMILQQGGIAPFEKELSTLRHKVTKREREILVMVGRGDTSRDIAEQLGISLKTVEAHRANLMFKLDAANAASLARWALIVTQFAGEFSGQMR